MKYFILLLLAVYAFAADECASADSDGKLLAPKAADDTIKTLGICKHYEEKTCCPVLDGTSGIAAAGIHQGLLATPLFYSGSCAMYSLLCDCYGCNPDLANADKAKKIANGICKDAVDDWYDACKDTPGFEFDATSDIKVFFASPDGDKVVSDHWSKAEKWWDEDAMGSKGQVGDKDYADLPDEDCWSAGSMVVPAVLALAAPLLALL
jgi:hypothetical protein